MINFKFFALHYLNDWYSDDSRFVAGLSSDNGREERLDRLREAATYYKVARTLRTINEDRLAGALCALDAVKPPITEENVDVTVCDLAKTLQAIYGTTATSAASKFLWIRHRAPVIIYDGRAIGCLKSRSEAFRQCDYPGYRKEWLRQFVDHEESIRTACTQLIAVKDFSLAAAISDEKLNYLVENRWFHERVFDKFLWWNAGGTDI
jgi:hypothetical protein